MRKLKIATLCLACAVPLAALGEPPAGPKRSDHGPGGGGGGGDHERMMNRGPGGGGEFNNPKEWEQFREQLRQFCRDHSPNRWREIEKRSERGGPDKGRLMIMGMAPRFRSLQAMEKEDKELYTIKVKEIEIEDAEYGLLVELKKSDGADKEKVDKIKDDLRSNSKKYVEQRLAERTHRIERLTKFLEKETVALKQDAQSQDRLVDERVNQLISEGPDFFNPRQPGRRGDGEGASTAPVPANINAAPVDTAPKR